MAGKALNFDTGVVEYKLNGAATVRFNPTDSDFANRFYDTLADLEGQQDSLRDAASSLDSTRDYFEFFKERDAEMRKAVDGLLGEGVADAVFAGMNCYALADGLPVWMNLMFAIADEIGEAMGAEQQKTDPRIKSYNKKYAELVAKYKPKTPSRQARK